MEPERSTRGGAGPPRISRPFVLLTWALAATLACAVVWWALASIADERGSARASVLTESEVVVLARQAATPPIVSTPSGTPGETPAPTESAPVVVNPPVTGSPTTAAPVPTRPPVTGPPRATPSPTTPPGATSPPATPPGAPDVARTWDVRGGQVGAACRGAQISLLYATPKDGWTVVVERAGPDEVEVKFLSDAARTTVRAVCRDGRPEQVSDGGDGGDG